MRFTIFIACALVCEATISNSIYESNSSSVLSCNSNENCHVECSNDNDTYSCHNRLILCPLSRDKNCSIECMDEYSCYNTTVYGVSVHNLYMVCDYQNACAFLTIYTPHTSNSGFTFVSSYHKAAQYVVMHINYTNEVYIRCLSMSACEYMTIHVQNTQLFHGYYSRSNAFLNGTIYATNINRMDVICPTSRACNNMMAQVQYIQFMAVECEINGCENMNINASHGTQLSLTCDECYGAKIIGHEADAVSLECHGYYSCKETTLHCPISIHSLCSIQCQTPQSCSNLTIFSANAYDGGTNNVQFNCYPGHTASYCDGATFVCAQVYGDSSCTMSNTQCISDTDSSCGVTAAPTYSPTPWTAHPTFVPSAATAQPSNHPSKSSAALPTVRKTNETKPTMTKKKASKTLFGIINYVIIFGCVICGCGICFISIYLGVFRHRNNEDRYVQQQEDGFPNVAMTEMNRKKSNCDEKDMKMEGITDVPIAECNDNNEETQEEIAPPPAYISQ